MNISAHFRLRLLNELNERCQNNPRYSMRAFARALDIESSALSRILRGKRAITPKMFSHIASKLNLSPSETAQFSSEIKPAPVFRELDQEVFNHLASWHNFAILELASTKNFCPDTRWIAKELNLSQSEVSLAVERLKRLGFLEIGRSGEWIVKTPNTTTPEINSSNDTVDTTAAEKTMQKQVLKKAIEAIDEVPIRHRDQSTVILAVDRTRLFEAKEIIKTFRRDILALMEKSSTKTEVYNLVVSFYPVTRTEKTPKEILCAN